MSILGNNNEETEQQKTPVNVTLQQSIPGPGTSSGKVATLANQGTYLVFYEHVSHETHRTFLSKYQKEKEKEKKNLKKRKRKLLDKAPPHFVTSTSLCLGSAISTGSIRAQ